MVLAWLGWWIVLAAFYALLSDTPAVPEVIAGVVAAAVGATGAVLVRRERHLLLRPRWAWLRGAGRPLRGLVADIVPLARALVRVGILRRSSRGTFSEVPFPRSGEDPEAAAYRAMTEWLGSIAPNTIVVGIDRERGTLLAHQLEPSADPAADAAPLPR